MSPEGQLNALCAAWDEFTEQLVEVVNDGPVLLRNTPEMWAAHHRIEALVMDWERARPTDFVTHRPTVLLCPLHAAAEEMAERASWWKDRWANQAKSDVAFYEALREATRTVAVKRIGGGLSGNIVVPGLPSLCNAGDFDSLSGEEAKAVLLAVMLILGTRGSPEAKPTPSEGALLTRVRPLERSRLEGNAERRDDGVRPTIGGEA